MKKSEIDLTEGSIVLKLVEFSFPLIVSSILQLLFNACDTVVVGKFSGKEALAAVGSTASLINLLTNLFMGLSIGTNVVQANYFGARKSSEMQQTVHTAILLSLISGVVLTVTGLVFARPILILMGSPDEVLVQATLYIQIYFAGITSTMVYNFGSALLRAKGDTKRPLYILLTAGIINVILNLIFVICFGLGIAGVGIATVISQAFSAIMIIVLLCREKDDFKLDFKKLKINKKIFLKIIKIGVPAGVQGIIFAVSNIIIQSSVNSFGTNAIAGNSATQSLEGFVYITMNSMAQANLTFCSQNLGALKFNRIKKVTVIAQIIAASLGFIIGNLVNLFGRELLSIYTDDSEAIQTGLTRLSLICTVYGLCGMMDCMANSIRGMGKSSTPMLITLFGACGFRIIWIMTVFQIPEYHSLSCIYISYALSWILTWIILLVFFVFIFRKIRRQFTGLH